MKRAVIFAHYDKDNIIDDYVIYYLNALKKIASDIVFVSCNPVENKQVLDGIVTKIIDEPHKEYDFGSYKRGYLYLKNQLNEYDELVFANDSCFGPFYPLENIFNAMDKKDCDFWGITKNNFGYKKDKSLFMTKRPHIQSYFIVLKKEVFLSEIFDKYINSIQKEEDKKQIISKYEIGLTELLVQNGFKYKVWINAYKSVNNIVVLKWRQIILKFQMPFIKCSLPRLKNKNVTTVAGYQDIIKQVSDYPIELIENNIERYGIKLQQYKKSCIITKRIVFDIASCLPYFIRRLIALTIGFCFRFLKD